jgi:tripartite-type tricarboxylate transporter receptor subunit TctC
MGEVFKTATGTNIVHVPYKGSGDAVVALIAGQIEMVFSDTPPAIPQIKGGKLRALASVIDRRYPALPDVPTLAEAGVPGDTPTTWWGILAPRGTPPAIIAKLNTEIGRALQLPDVAEKFTGLGVFPLHTTPEQVTERIKVETPAMTKIFKAAGVEPE